MSSACRSAVSTIGSCTGTAMRRTGGRTCKWRRSQSQRSFGKQALQMLPQRCLATNQVCDRSRGCVRGVDGICDCREGMIKGGEPTHDRNGSASGDPSRVRVLAARGFASLRRPCFVALRLAGTRRAMSAPRHRTTNHTGERQSSERG